MAPTHFPAWVGALTERWTPRMDKRPRRKMARSVQDPAHKALRAFGTLPPCCASDLVWRGSKYATVVVGHAVRAHSARLLCRFVRAPGGSPDGVRIVVLDTGSLQGLGAGDDGVDV